MTDKDLLKKYASSHSYANASGLGQGRKAATEASDGADLTRKGDTMQTQVAPTVCYVP